MNVLISPIGGQAIYGIAHYFKKRGFKTFGIDRNPEAVGRFFVDEFLRVPDIGTEEYFNTILRIISEKQIDIFISWLDPEILFWNEKFYTGGLPNDLRKIFCFSFSEKLKKLCDKYTFMCLLEKENFNCPKTHLLNEIHKDRLFFPAIIKPRFGSGSKSIYVLENREDFRYYYQRILIKAEAENFLIQEFIRGTEYTIDFFAENGVLINLVIRKRLEHRGVSLRGEVVYNKEIELLTYNFCKTFNLDGLNNMQVIETANELFVIEFNPRPSGTIMLSINAGVDLLNNLIEKRFDKNLTTYGPPKLLKMVRYLNELYYE